MTSTRVLLVLSVALLLGGARAAADVATPPPPAEYDVRLRYEINAFRNERLVQYFALIKYLESIGFKKAEGAETEPEDTEANRMTGTMPSANARRLFAERHIRTVLLIPHGAMLPAEAEQPVHVSLELANGLPPDRQRVFAQQTADVLAGLGFREAVGYDNRGHTRLVGMIPVGKLDTLLADLRRLPDADKVPVPFQNLSPLRLIEVAPDVPAPKEPAPRPPLPAGKEYLLKISPDLQDLLAREGEADKPGRMEVILGFTPAADQTAWQRSLTSAAPSLMIEGRLGPLVSVFGRQGLAVQLAAVPEVAAVRLPRSGQPQLEPGSDPKDLARDALRASGLDQLHAQGYRGKNIRAAIIDGDFRGWEAALAAKRLPAGTRFVDLTAARNPNLEAEPFAGDPQKIGHGTRAAVLLALAAPDADITLVRVDPAAPYQVQTVARSINGDPVRSESLMQRGEELDAYRQDLMDRRRELNAERKEVLDKFIDIKEKEILGKKPPAELTPTEKERLDAIKRYEDYFKKQAEFDKEERTYQGRVTRYLKLLGDLRGLKGIRVVSSALVWNEGHPVDGSSTLSRYFDDRPFRSVLWFQSAGDTRGQNWAGLFRDADGNGVMEFVPSGTHLRPNRWTPELNFLGWQPPSGAPVAELPVKARVRVAIQWREAHDPELYRNGEDLYREPLAMLRLVVLRQRDPAGAKLAADELDVVARSMGLPQRIDNQPSCSTYEQTVEFVADPAGRYALRVEGQAPTGSRPRTVATLPALDRSGELRPRIFLQTLEGNGRAVFVDFPTEEGAIGMPGDAHQVLTVGAADEAGRRQRSSAGGSPYNLELLPKPNVLVLDHATNDTGMATSFAAGLAASALSAGAPQAKILQGLGVEQGGLLRIPPDWLGKRR